MTELAAGARAPEFTLQSGAAYRFDWGPNGLRALAAGSDVVIVVDVLRFTSAVCAALESGTTVYPYRWADDGAPAFAAARGARLAGLRENGEPSLSPTDLLCLEPGTHLVLPSPNGSALCFAAAEHGARNVLAGCLRNAEATARRARQLAGHGGTISVIAAGERWHGHTGPIRPAVEDLLGAGAILHALDPAAALSPPRCSPEAAAARAAFLAAKPTLLDTLEQCSSGRELVARGWADDVATAAALNVSTTVAELKDGRFQP